jgi:hypothetical protein
MNQNTPLERIDDMQTLIESQLHKLPSVPPPQGLLSSILSLIASRKELRRFKRELTSAGFFLLGILGLTIGYFEQLRQEVEASSLGAYASLVLQDSDVFLQHWQDAALTFLDALPVYSLLSALSLLGILSFSLFFITRHRAFVKQSRLSTTHHSHPIHS